MNKNMKTICREIENGVNLDFNLPPFFNRLASLYVQYAELKFTMHYYTFYENYFDSGLVRANEEEQLLKEVNSIIKDILLSDFSGEKMEDGVKRLDAVRNIIISRMEILAAYTDIFRIFEYIFNRIEYRFREDITEINEEEFAAEVLRYIFDTRDNVIINEKIKEVIGELPVRLTKSRYFDLIRDSISIYKGADRSSLDGYLYRMKNGAMLYEPEGMDTAYKELYFLKNTLEALDYKSLTQEEYSAYSKQLEETAGKISSSADFYIGLQECVNHLYVMLLLAPYAYMEGYRIESFHGEMKFLLLAEEGNHCKSLIKVINAHFLADEKMPLEKELEDKLIYTEGRQELISEEFEALEYYFFNIKSNHLKMVESLMLGPLFHCLSTAQKLLGSSLFVKLDSEDDGLKVDKGYQLKVQDEFILKLTELFLNNSKYVSRAVMANTIDKMPVFFQSPTDVLNYIKNSLEQCHDRAEKVACVNIIKTFFEN